MIAATEESCTNVRHASGAGPGQMDNSFFKHRNLLYVLQDLYYVILKIEINLNVQL